MGPTDHFSSGRQQLVVDHPADRLNVERRQRRAVGDRNDVTTGLLARALVGCLGGCPIVMRVMTAATATVVRTRSTGGREHSSNRAAAQRRPQQGRCGERQDEQVTPHATVGSEGMNEREYPNYP
jgi:hypothetical protein